MEWRTRLVLMFIEYFLYNFSSLIINKKANKYAEATSKHMKKKTHDYYYWRKCSKHNKELIRYWKIESKDSKVGNRRKEKNEEKR